MITQVLQRLSARTTVLAGVCLGAALAVAAPVDGAVIVRYDLSPATTNSVGSQWVQIQDDVTASRYTVHGTTSVSSGTHNVRVDSGTNIQKLSSIEASIENDMYGAFSVTVADGQQLSLSSLQFGMRNDRGYPGQFFSVHLRSSLDGFASDVAVATQLRTDADTADTQGPETKTIDLSSAAFQELTGTVTFRLYMVTTIVNNTGSGEYIRIMPDIILNGEVAPAVPEPAMLGLAGLGGLVMVRRRRA